MEKEIKLSITIPTYNRCKLLKVAMDSVLSQWRDDIELLVSDNASVDGTEELMRDYCEKYPITYVRNPENLGAEKNFLNCFRMAKGKYVHLLSDDDLLIPGAIERIIQLLDKEEPDYINLNSIYYFNDVFDPKDQRSPRIPLEEDLITTNKKEYIEKIGVYITYASAIVLKRSEFLRVKNPEQYLGTYFLQAHMLFDILKDDNSKVIITKEAYIAAKHNNSGGFNLYEVWVKQYKKLLLETAVKNGFDYKQMEQIYLKDIHGFIKDSIIKYRVVDKTYDMSKRWLFFTNTYMYPSVWKLWIYAILPEPILYRIYMWRRRKRNKMK